MFQRSTRADSWIVKARHAPAIFFHLNGCLSKGHGVSGKACQEIPSEELGYIQFDLRWSSGPQGSMKSVEGATFPAC